MNVSNILYNTKEKKKQRENLRTYKMTIDTGNSTILYFKIQRAMTNILDVVFDNA